MAATDAMVALFSTTLAAATSSVTIAGIPTTGYRDLRLIVDVSVSPSEGNIVINFNGDNGSNYSYVNMRSFSSGSLASSASTSSSIVSNYSTGLQTSSRAINIYDIMDYAQTDKHKSVLVRANHSAELDAIAARWANTAAINTITISNGNFTAGSTFTLYGIKA